MSKYVKHLSLAILFACLFVIFTTGNVYAEDGATEEPIAAEAVLEETPPVEDQAAPEEGVVEEQVGEALPDEGVAEEPMLVETAPEEVVVEPVGETLPDEGVTEEPLLVETAPEEVVVEMEEEALLEEVAAEETLVEEVVQEEESVVEEPPTGEEVFIEEPAPEEPVVLVDGEGKPLIMATEETAELLSSGDPYYKVGSKTYSFYAAGGMCGGTPFCFDGQGSDVIQDALNYMATSGLPSNRLLYVEGGTYDGFTINGFGDPVMALLNGVIGVDGSENTLINSGGINVINNLGGFNLQGFSIDSGGGVYFNNNSGTATITDVVVEHSGAAFGVEVSDHNGAIILESVKSSHNDKSGAKLENWATSYPVTVTDSGFYDNGWVVDSGSEKGIEVWSNGTVTFDGVVANWNDGDGVDVWEYGTLKVSNTFMDSNTSESSSWGYALWASTNGSGTAYLEDVYAYGNDYGVYVSGGSLRAKDIEVNDSQEGNGLVFYSQVGSSRVENGNFHNNHLDGLHIQNKGSVYLSSIQSGNNGGAGAYLDNAYYNYTLTEYVGIGPVTLTSPTSGGYQMANGFWGNGDSGLVIMSRGTVTIANVDLGNNGSLGLDVDNTYGSGIVTVYTTLKNWYNGVNGNGNGGIDIRSNGMVKMSDTSADWNGGDGMWLVTNGNIELVNSSATGNIGVGAYLRNDASTYPRTVKFTDARFDHNQGNGITVYSRGSITANGLSASGNSLRDFNLGSYSNVVTYNDILGEDWVEDVYRFDGMAGQWVDLHLESREFNSYLVLIDPDGNEEASDDDGWYDLNSHIGLNLAKTGTYTVVVKSVNNSGSGEYAFSLNDAGQTNIHANFYDGAVLDNTYGSAGVTIYKPRNLDNMWGNFFDRNTADGIKVFSNGTISLDSLHASENFFKGLMLDNPTSRASVTVQNTRMDGFYSEFNANDEKGIYIATLGNITVKNIGAWSNNETGVYINNEQGGAGFGGVKVLGLSDRSNDFGHNGGNGLGIYSNGSVQLVNIYAEANGGNGVWVQNSYTGKTGYVTVTTAGRYGWNNLDNNQSNGMVILSNGSITLNNVSANGNGGSGDGSGIQTQNLVGTSAPGISITRGDFSNNNNNGLVAYSNGPITWRYGGAWNNGDRGAYLENSNGTGYVTVSGSSRERMGFGDNGWQGSGYDGLEVATNGKITLAYADAGHNSGDGFHLGNQDSATNQRVDVTEVDIYGNQQTGLAVSSKGAITVNGINSHDNGYQGAWLVNSNGIGGVTVTTTSSWTENHFDRNGWNSSDWSGLVIKTAGSVYMKNIGADGNSGNGIDVNNSWGTAPVTYASTGSAFWLSNNGHLGLYIYSKGNVILINQYGLYADNNNGDFGLQIYNQDAPVPSYVKLYKVNANNNQNGDGLKVEASGYIYASSLTAQNNQYEGTYMYSVSGTVTISGANYFRDNGGWGLYVLANGNVSVSNATAWSNGVVGMYIEVGSGGNVSMYNITAAHNQATGVLLAVDGNTTVNRMLAFLNGQSDAGGLFDDGLSILPTNLSSKVSILNSIFKTNWWGSGIEIKHPDPAFWPYLYKVKYLTNGETDLYVHT